MDNQLNWQIFNYHFKKAHVFISGYSSPAEAPTTQCDKYISKYVVVIVVVLLTHHKLALIYLNGATTNLFKRIQQTFLPIFHTQNNNGNTWHVK